MRVLALGSLCLSLTFVGVLAITQEAQKTRAQVTQNTTSTPSFREEVIGRISPGSELQDLAASEHHIAWVEKQSGSLTVRLDGKQQGGVYQEVKYLGGSTDETHLAFFGKRASKWFLVMDGQERAREYTKTSALAFQPKGASFAYCACVEKKCRLVVDGADTGAEYEDISYPQYSPDGKKIAYLAKRTKRWIAVVDGKEAGPELGDYVDFGFDSDGNRFYVAGRVGNHWRLSYVVDGRAGPEFEVLSPIAFSSDGKRYAYGGTTKKPGFKKEKVVGTMVLDGVDTAEYEGEGISRLTWRAALGAKGDLVPGVRDFSPDFDGFSNPAFDSEGKLVYAVRRGKGNIVVLKGSDSGPGFEEILSPITFTHDAKHFVYVGGRGETFVQVRDNTPIRTLSAGYRAPFAIEWIRLTGDGSHIAYEVVSGSKETSQREMHLVNVDGHESRLYDDVLGVWFIEDEKLVVFAGRDGMRFLRVTYALNSTTAALLFTSGASESALRGRRCGHSYAISALTPERGTRRSG